MQTVTKTCSICLEQFEGVPQRKYCCPVCSTLAQLRNSDKARVERRAAKVLMKRICPTCEQTFETHSVKRFCSPICRAISMVPSAIHREYLTRLLIREREKFH